jgi:PRTRC genetic system protein E
LKRFDTRRCGRDSEVQEISPVKPTQPHEEKRMFTELMPLLQKRRLLLSISVAEGGRIRVTLIPQKVTETEDNAITTPLAISGTAEELDRELPGQLAEFVAIHLQLQSTLAMANAEMEAAAKAAREERGRKRRQRPRHLR